MKEWISNKGNKITRILSGKSKAFFLSNGQNHILIDTGTPSRWNALQRNLDKMDFNKIDLLILTHSHFDHAGNAGRVKEKYNPKVLVQRTEASYLSDGESIPPVGATFFTKMLLKILSKLPESFSRYQACQPDFIIDDTFDLSDFGFNSYLMHTPGHTPGSISLIIDEEIALVGDAMFGLNGLTISPPFASDENQLVNSWQNLLKTGCKIFIPSHGIPVKRSFVERYLKKKVKK